MSCLTDPMTTTALPMDFDETELREALADFMAVISPDYLPYPIPEIIRRSKYGEQLASEIVRDALEHRAEVRKLRPDADKARRVFGPDNPGGRKPDVPWEVGLPRVRELMRDRERYPTLIAALRAVDSELNLVFNRGDGVGSLDKALYAWHKRACSAEQRAARLTGIRGLR